MPFPTGSSTAIISGSRDSCSLGISLVLCFARYSMEDVKVFTPPAATFTAYGCNGCSSRRRVEQDRGEKEETFRRLGCKCWSSSARWRWSAATFPHSTAR